MKKLDSRDFQLLFELMKNSRTSDRKLAKMLGCSQPTVTRRRNRLEDDTIEGYTAIPDFGKIGYELVAFTFVHSRVRFGKPERRRKALQKTREWYMKQPSVIFALAGEGMGWDGVCISFHKSYSAFAQFIRKHDSELSEFIEETQTFVADLNPGIILKPLHLKYLAETK